MKELQLSKEVLKLVHNEGIPFRKALKTIVPYNSEDYHLLAAISSLVGSELRHHLLFKKIVETYAPNNDEEKQLFLLLALANFHFSKRLDNNEVRSYLISIDIIGDYEQLFPEAGVYDVLKTLYPESNSLDFLSLRFNTPSWLIKMWQKHFSYGKTFKILKKNTRAFPRYVRINDFLIHEDVLNADDKKEFSKTKFEGIYTYEGNHSIRKNDFYRNFQVFDGKPMNLELIKKVIREDDIKELFAYVESDKEFSLELILATKKEIGLNLGVASINDNPLLMRLMRVGKLKNINLFDASSDALHAYVTSKQDLVIAYPKSTSFDLIRMEPDFLYHFDRNSIDELIVHQEKFLDDLSSYVNEDGKLVYIINTLNRKESVDLISKFLSLHPDFKLVEQRQYFPYEEFDGAFYIAILKKEETSEA